MRLKIDEDGIRTMVEQSIGKSLTSCLQCSKCGGGCVHSEEFDLTPRQVVESLLDCQDGKVLDSRMIWLCGRSCSACQAVCPVGLPLNEIMAVLREEAGRRGIEPKYEKPSMIYYKFEHCAKHQEEGEASESSTGRETQPA
ncbi:Alpha-helical ferredoxin [Acididesulfobacillus acetoxydans]|uniref:Alpha-helical ferredoxin n=1 Tax=Acididesulfobacillus acetoxydans TaxID=1561005 RepID=A0A8S0W8Z4_9FIRM|nr:4Fe-4S dicluster domain-containing protein [Acididesulfobacillus acetoxydans]CAA7602219.1 Alpha-helical ferredoxin [Acididesulfobacillus acetoxydans]CEJ07563.1 Alpha-helical ferredoxin [Acididesulfobacillus acetoxydans]